MKTQKQKNKTLNQDTSTAWESVRIKTETKNIIALIKNSLHLKTYDEVIRFLLENCEEENLGGLIEADVIKNLTKSFTEDY